jgi:hypothetical protein
MARGFGASLAVSLQSEADGSGSRLQTMHHQGWAPAVHLLIGQVIE